MSPPLEEPSPSERASLPSRRAGSVVWSGGGAALVSVGRAPAPALGASIFGAARWGWRSLQIEARAFLPASNRLDNGVGVQTWLVEGVVVPCYASGRLAACVLASAGARWATATGESQNVRERVVPVFSLGARLQADLVATGSFALRVHGDLGAPLTRTLLEVGGRQVWRSPPLSGLLGVGVALPFLRTETGPRPETLLVAEPRGAPDFRAIFEGELGYVLATLRRLGVRPADTSDLAQEVFLTVHGLLDDYDPARPLRPWLFGIAYRIARRYQSLVRHAREVHEDTPDAPAPGLLPDGALEADQARQIVREALERIELSRRSVFILCDLDGLGAPEAAAVLGIPLNTAYSRLRRARAEFSAAVERLRARERP